MVNRRGQVGGYPIRGYRRPGTAGIGSLVQAGTSQSRQKSLSAWGSQARRRCRRARPATAAHLMLSRGARRRGSGAARWPCRSAGKRVFERVGEACIAAGLIGRCDTEVRLADRPGRAMDRCDARGQHSLPMPITISLTSSSASSLMSKLPEPSVKLRSAPQRR
jgi:hypothetical protein